MAPLIGILQGRLTRSLDGQLQFFPKNAWQEEFFAASRLGFDCIEPLADKVGENPIWEDSGGAQIADLCAKTGVGVHSVHGFYNRQSDYVATLSRLITQAARVGAKSILIPFFDDEVLDSEEKFETAIAALGETGSVGQQSGVRLGIEAELSTEATLQLVSAIGHSHVGIYYDIGNMASMGKDTAAEIETFGERIVGVHIKDRLPHGGRTVPLGTGCADFDAAFAALAAIGYDGPFILQPARVPSKDDLALQAEYLEFVREKIAKYFDEDHQERRMR